MTIEKLNAGPIDATAQASGKTAKLKDGAQQFEAMMLEQMLKPLHFGAATGDDGEEVTGAAGTVQDFGTEAVAKALASHGGFGLARQIVRQVTAEQQSTSRIADGTKE